MSQHLRIVLFVSSMILVSADSKWAQNDELDLVRQNDMEEERQNDMENGNKVQRLKQFLKEKDELDLVRQNDMDQERQNDMENGKEPGNEPGVLYLGRQNDMDQERQNDMENGNKVQRQQFSKESALEGDHSKIHRVARCTQHGESCSKKTNCCGHPNRSGSCGWHIRCTFNPPCCH